MNQFKDNFLGRVDAGYNRATTAQKCVRAGGKHNDLENVGFTPRHHTFFEMMGNFSFGDYFKKEAIHFAWDFLTNHLQIPANRLRVTVFTEDDEAFDLWKAEGVDPNFIERLGEDENFWAMGDTGPCGPCSEIHYDWGPKMGLSDANASPGNDTKGRFLEIWNLVFMQFNRDETGNLNPLPKPSVDTGAGLERLAAVMQDVFSNYETDLFVPLIQAIAKKTGVAIGKSDDLDISMRVVADHLRSGVFLLTDGVNPSNEGRGYVLRRILRRAIRHGKKLGQEKPFLNELAKDVATLMGPFYPELNSQLKLVQTILKEEEVRFHETLHRGMAILEDALSNIKQAKQKQLPGDIAFKLYDSYGFPVDLVQVICVEHGFTVDMVTFEQGMEDQRAKSSWKGGDTSKSLAGLQKQLDPSTSTQFLGYTQLQSDGNVIALFDDKGEPASSIDSGQAGFVVFDKTPFYAESGGQVGDTGKISGAATAQVQNTFKIGSCFIHQVIVKQASLSKGTTYQLSVDKQTRKQTAINHTATHLMHAALRSILGDRVKQAGSHVDAQRLRFDFTYPKSLTEDQKSQIEAQVNREVLAAKPVTVLETDFESATKAGALAFFDEKYGDTVRVITVGSDKDRYSVELCGGTHLTNSAEIGLFKIVNESAVASGVRRIEAITSANAISYVFERERIVNRLERQFSVDSSLIEQRVQQLTDDLKSAKRKNEELKAKVLAGGGTGASGSLWERGKSIGGLTLVAETLGEAEPKVLRSLVDQIRDKLQQKTIVMLATESEGKIAFCVGVTKDLTKNYSAGDAVRHLATTVNGRGGGKPDFAQGGGNDPSKIHGLADSIASWIESKQA